MTSKPMRLTDEAEMIALKYGETVSKGIVEMERKLQVVAVPVAKTALSATIPVTPLPVGTGNTSSGFQRASGAPSPTIVGAVASPMIDGMPAEYWKRFIKEIDAAFEKAQRGY